MTDSTRIVFGLRDFPRPKRMGYLYYRLPSRFSKFHEKTLAVLDLYNVDEQYLTDIFHEGIAKLLKQKHLSDKIAYLEHFETENMEASARTIFEKVVQKIISQSKQKEDA